MKFAIKEIYPCTESQGITLEGEFKGIDLTKLKSKIEDIAEEIFLLSESGILICKIKGITLYFYDDGKLVLSNVNSRTEGESLLNMVLKL